MMKSFGPLVVAALPSCIAETERPAPASEPACKQKSLRVLRPKVRFIRFPSSSPLDSAMLGILLHGRSAALNRTSGYDNTAGSVSTSRTLAAKESGLNGFGREDTSGSRIPCRAITSAVYP